MHRRVPIDGEVLIGHQSLANAEAWDLWGWGTATRQLIAAVDAVEAERRFEPPL